MQLPILPFPPSLYDLIHLDLTSTLHPTLPCCVCLQEDRIPILAQFTPSRELSVEEAERIPKTGNSPVLMSMDQMRTVVPLYHRLNVAMYKNEESRKVSTTTVQDNSVNALLWGA